MGRNIHNSIIVRVDHHYSYPTNDWFELMEELRFYVVSQAQGEVGTIPGPRPAEVDWLFELETDAAWFMLRHGGEIVDPAEFSKLSGVSFG